MIIELLEKKDICVFTHTELNNGKNLHTKIIHWKLVKVKVNNSILCQKLHYMQFISSNNKKRSIIL